MPLEYLDPADPEFATFERFTSEPPYAVLDRHPGGAYVALVAPVPWDGRSAAHAAVWATDSGRVVWRPEGLLALCWLPGGREMLVVRDRGVPKPHLAGVGFFRGERPERAWHMRTIERTTWPDDPTREEPRALDAAPMPTVAGEVMDIVPSPTDSLAAVVWLDQTEAGIELVSWADGSPLSHLPHRGYFGGHSNVMNTPTFSPDGRYLTLVYEAFAWWSGDAEDPEEPSPGGTFPCGRVVMGDVMQGNYAEYPVRVTVPEGWVPEGWTPDDPLQAEGEFLSRAEFTDAETLTVRLATGEARRFHVTAGPLD